MYAVVTTAVGIPLLFLGDEIGQLNDTTFLDDPHTASDNRWMHRPYFDWEALRAAEEGEGPGAGILAGVRRLAEIRTALPPGLGLPEIVESPDPGILAFLRRTSGARLLAAVNLSESDGSVEVPEGAWQDMHLRSPVTPGPLPLGPYEYRILLDGE